MCYSMGGCSVIYLILFVASLYTAFCFVLFLSATVLVVIWLQPEHTRIMCLGEAFLDCHKIPALLFLLYFFF